MKPYDIKIAMLRLNTKNFTNLLNKITYKMDRAYQIVCSIHNVIIEKEKEKYGLGK